MVLVRFKLFIKYLLFVADDICLYFKKCIRDYFSKGKYRKLRLDDQFDVEFEDAETIPDYGGPVLVPFEYHFYSKKLFFSIGPFIQAFFYYTSFVIVVCFVIYTLIIWTDPVFDLENEEYIKRLSDTTFHVDNMYYLFFARAFVVYVIWINLMNIFAMFWTYSWLKWYGRRKGYLVYKYLDRLDASSAERLIAYHEHSDEIESLVRLRYPQYFIGKYKSFDKMHIVPYGFRAFYQSYFIRMREFYVESEVDPFIDFLYYVPDLLVEEFALPDLLTGSIGLWQRNRSRRFKRYRWCRPIIIRIKPRIGEENCHPWRRPRFPFRIRSLRTGYGFFFRSFKRHRYSKSSCIRLKAKIGRRMPVVAVDDLGYERLRFKEVNFRSGAYSWLATGEDPAPGEAVRKSIQRVRRRFRIPRFYKRSLGYYRYLWAHKTCRVETDEDEVAGRYGAWNFHYRADAFGHLRKEDMD